MVEPLKPKRGGFQHPFRCGEFIRDFLLGLGPYDSLKIDPEVGAAQSTVFRQYKLSLMKAIAVDKAAQEEDKAAKKENRRINLENIEKLARKYFEKLPYKSIACRYHSFIIYVSDLQRLGWIEPTGLEEPSLFQNHYEKGKPKRYFRLTLAGKEAEEGAWRNPHKFLYRSKKSSK